VESRISERRKKVVAGVTWVTLLSVLALTIFSIWRDLGSNVARAHNVKTPSKVTIRYNANKKKFHGRVKADRRACRRNRRVTLVRARRGISDKVVKRDRTNKRGRWSIKRKRRSKGRFYVVVAKRVRRTGYQPGPHKHKCKRDFSPTLKLPRR
jgi:hypothetical protein